LRVVASDGTFTAQADSPSFLTAMKPPVPRILTESGLRVHYGDLVNLSGLAEDYQNDNITDGNLVWSNDAGVMGVSNTLSISTPPIGTNVITLTATNSQGFRPLPHHGRRGRQSRPAGPILSACRNSLRSPRATRRRRRRLRSASATWAAARGRPPRTGVAHIRAAVEARRPASPSRSIGGCANSEPEHSYHASIINGQMTQTLKIPVLMSVGVLFNDARGACIAHCSNSVTATTRFQVRIVAQRSAREGDR
jgi:hypothetical protein